MDEMATNTEYILRMVLELIDKCKTLDELREAVKAVLGAPTKRPAPQTQKGGAGSLPPARLHDNRVRPKYQGGFSL